MGLKLSAYFFSFHDSVSEEYLIESFLVKSSNSDLINNIIRASVH